jgi:hypothetical protein
MSPLYVIGLDTVCSTYEYVGQLSGHTALRWSFSLFSNSFGSETLVNVQHLA